MSNIIDRYIYKRVIHSKIMVKESDLNPKIEEPDPLRKEVNIQHTGRQFIVQIPIQIIEILNIKKGDKFVFEVPLKFPKKYSFRLKEKPIKKSKKKNGK